MGVTDFSIEDLLDILPDLIDSAVRQNEKRPPAPEHGLASIKTGVAVSADSLSAQIVFDDDDPEDPPHTIQAATAIKDGDRVLVLLRAGGGAYAIGSGQAQSTGVQSVVAGTNITVDDTDPQNPIVSSTAAGSGFPIGPYDNLIGVHEIAVLAAGNATIGQTAIATSVISDAHSYVVSSLVTAISHDNTATGTDNADQAVYQTQAQALPAGGAAQSDLRSLSNADGSWVAQAAFSASALFSSGIGTPVLILRSADTGADASIVGQGAPINVHLAELNDNLGFFGVTPVGQQPTPTVLADVIAILQAFGLAA